MACHYKIRVPWYPKSSFLIFKTGCVILRNDCLASFRDNRLVTLCFVGGKTVSAEISVLFKTTM